MKLRSCLAEQDRTQLMRATLVPGVIPKILAGQQERIGAAPAKLRLSGPCGIKVTNAGWNFESDESVHMGLGVCLRI
jgi:hypothetical protein